MHPREGTLNLLLTQIKNKNQTPEVSRFLPHSLTFQTTVPTCNHSCAASMKLLCLQGVAYASVSTGAEHMFWLQFKAKCKSP